MIIARVSSVYPEKGTARVYREDINKVSNELIVLRRGDEWFPKVGDHVACLFYSNSKSTGVILGEA